MNTYKDNSTDLELEEMKREMQLLREDIQQQQVFSDKTMRNIMGQRQKWISSLVKTEIYLVIPVVILMYIGIKFLIGLSWPFVIVTCLFCIADVIWDKKINRLSSADFATMSLMELKEQLHIQQKSRRRQMLIETPLVILWTGWFAYDLTTNALGILREMPGWIWYVVMAVLLPIALAVVAALYKKMQASDSASIKDIDMLDEENRHNA